MYLQNNRNMRQIMNEYVFTQTLHHSMSQYLSRVKMVWIQSFPSPTLDVKLSSALLFPLAGWQ